MKNKADEIVTAWANYPSSSPIHARVFKLRRSCLRAKHAASRVLPGRRCETKILRFLLFSSFVESIVSAGTGARRICADAIAENASRRVSTRGAARSRMISKVSGANFYMLVLHCRCRTTAAQPDHPENDAFSTHLFVWLIHSG
jgi:hypothetical protein